MNMSMNVQQTINELCSVSVEDRLRIVHAVWDSLPEDAEAPVSPEQRAELNRRIDAYEANPDDLLTWDQVLEQLRGRL